MTSPPFSDSARRRGFFSFTRNAVLQNYRVTGIEENLAGERCDRVGRDVLTHVRDSIKFHRTVHRMHLRDVVRLLADLSDHVVGLDCTHVEDVLKITSQKDSLCNQWIDSQSHVSCTAKNTLKRLIRLSVGLTAPAVSMSTDDDDDDDVKMDQPFCTSLRSLTPSGCPGLETVGFTFPPSLETLRSCPLPPADLVAALSDCTSAIPFTTETSDSPKVPAPNTPRRAASVFLTATLSRPSLVFVPVSVPCGTLLTQRSLHVSSGTVAFHLLHELCPTLESRMETLFRHVDSPALNVEGIRANIQSSTVSDFIDSHIGWWKEHFATVRDESLFKFG